MKLRNKKTGIVVECFNNTDGIFPNSLAELEEKWEDVPEEPKGINEIDVVLDAIGEYCNEHSYYSGDLEKIKILNAVEDKLKAWKRLKDNSWKLVHYNIATREASVIFSTGYTITEQDRKDLDLLLSQEDD